MATLLLDVDQDGGAREGNALGLDGHDLGVHIEPHDAAQRIRFEHPAVRTVIVTGARELRRQRSGDELALSCDEIILVDGRSSSVSLPCHAGPEFERAQR